MTIQIKQSEIRWAHNSIDPLQFQHPLNIGERLDSYDKHSSGYDIYQCGDLFAVELWWSSWDDADNWYHIYQNLEDAKQGANRYINNEYHNENKIYILVNGDEEKSITGVNYQGYICRQLSEGNVHVPYVDSASFDSQEQIEEYKAYMSTKPRHDIKYVIGTEWEKNLLKIGKNRSGKIIVTSKEYASFKKEVRFQMYDCWETGIIYYKLANRVPKEIFSKLELKYHAEEQEEEGNWKGWYTTNKKQLMNTIQELGWKTNLA